MENKDKQIVEICFCCNEPISGKKYDYSNADYRSFYDRMRKGEVVIDNSTQKKVCSKCYRKARTKREKQLHPQGKSTEEGAVPAKSKDQVSSKDKIKKRSTEEPQKMRNSLQDERSKKIRVFVAIKGEIVLHHVDPHITLAKFKESIKDIAFSDFGIKSELKCLRLVNWKESKEKPRCTEAVILNEKGWMDTIENNSEYKAEFSDD